MKNQILAALVALTVTASTAALAQTPPKLPTPPEVWAKYDPDAGDFKEEIISEDLVFHKMRNLRVVGWVSF